VEADIPEDDWSEWVFASETYNWTDKNPLLDWLDAYGTKAGFVADSRRPGYDKRFDYVSFTRKQSWAFQRAVLAWLLAHSPLRTIATNPNQARDPAKQQQTLAAMKEGVPIIAHGVLWNRDLRMAGMVDLLVRSDVLTRIMPDAFAAEPSGASAVSAPALGTVPYHYRAIHITFVTLDLLKDGTASHTHIPSMVQNWIINEALGKTQGYTPLVSYLAGRDLFRAPARVNQADPELQRLATEAATWIRRLRKDGASWHPLPLPSVPELRPNMKAFRDQEWRTAKHGIALAQHDLTLLPYVGPERRALAAAAGITRWDDPGLSARTLGLGDSTEGRRLDAVLMANRSSGDQAVFPARLASNIGNWQQAASLEIFANFQYVNDQADDFSRLPERGGTPMVFMITCGYRDRDSKWQSWQHAARDLSLSAEAELKSAFVAELNRLADLHGLQLRDVHIFHWGNREVPLPDLTWIDLLDNLIHPELVTVRGAFSFGLADMARALHALGLIETALPDRPVGPLETMAGAWSSEKEAASLRIPLEEAAPIQIIGRFSQALCRSMMETLVFLRQRARASLEEAA
jgi:hypothetical protein